jgi:hypothetical protein
MAGHQPTSLRNIWCRRRSFASSGWNDANHTTPWRPSTGTPSCSASTSIADPDIIAKVSRGLGEAMRGDEIDKLDTKLADRGW